MVQKTILGEIRPRVAITTHRTGQYIPMSTTLPDTDPAIIQPPVQAAAASGAESKPVPTDPSKLPKTTGEKYYDVLQFLSGKAFIVVVSAVIAYVARYGPDKYGKMPNVLKKFQDGFEKLLNEGLGLGKSNIGKYFSGFASATTLTMWGGNLFSPFLKWFENNKEKISNHYNRKHGKPGEVEIAHERLKDLPQQNWWDILKGRAVGWVIVCSSFIGVDWIISKDMKKDLSNSKLAKFEEKVGRWMAGFTKTGKEIAKTPITQALTDVQKQNKTYRVGRIVALDLFATSAAIVIWNAVSRMSAKRRHARIEKDLYDIPVRDIVDSLSHHDSSETPVTTIPKAPKIEPRVAGGYVKMTSEPATNTTGIGV